MDIIDIGKKLLQAIKDGDGITASQLILELEAMALDLRNENERLREQVARLEARVELADNMTFDGTYYWRGEGDTRDGPFCQKCLDGEHRAIRLQYKDKTVSDYKSAWYECHNCQSKIEL